MLCYRSTQGKFPDHENMRFWTWDSNIRFYIELFSWFFNKRMSFEWKEPWKLEVVYPWIPVHVVILFPRILMCQLYKLCQLVYIHNLFLILCKTWTYSWALVFRPLSQNENHKLTSVSWLMFDVIVLVWPNRISARLFSFRYLPDVDLLDGRRRNKIRASTPKKIFFRTGCTSLLVSPLWWMFRVKTVIAVARETMAIVMP